MAPCHKGDAPLRRGHHRCKPSCLHCPARKGRAWVDGPRGGSPPTTEPCALACGVRPASPLISPGRCRGGLPATIARMSLSAYGSDSLSRRIGGRCADPRCRQQHRSNNGRRNRPGFGPCRRRGPRPAARTAAGATPLARLARALLELALAAKAAAMMGSPTACLEVARAGAASDSPLGRSCRR